MDVELEFASFLVDSESAFGFVSEVDASGVGALEGSGAGVTDGVTDGVTSGSVGAGSSESSFSSGSLEVSDDESSGFSGVSDAPESESVFSDTESSVETSLESTTVSCPDANGSA